MKVIEHFKTITEHKLLVMRYCFRIGLYRQGLLHDISKYMPSEFMVGCRYFQGTRSPNNAEREVKGYSSAWLHHKGRNKHHMEYWIDYNDKEEGAPMAGMKMPRRYVAEMLMDRIAASRIYNRRNYNNSYPLAYFEKGKQHYMIHPETLGQLHGLLLILNDKGEEALFWYVKNKFLKNK